MAQNKRLYLNIFKSDFLFEPIPLSLQIPVLQARILSVKELPPVALYQSILKLFILQVSSRIRGSGSVVVIIGLKSQNHNI
jgi:hypothetical protein